jgi:hypothetical protein
VWYSGWPRKQWEKGRDGWEYIVCKRIQGPRSVTSLSGETGATFGSRWPPLSWSSEVLSGSSLSWGREWHPSMSCPDPRRAMEHPASRGRPRHTTHSTYRHPATAGQIRGKKTMQCHGGRGGELEGTVVARGHVTVRVDGGSR